MILLTARRLAGSGKRVADHPAPEIADLLRDAPRQADPFTYRRCLHDCRLTARETLAEAVRGIVCAVCNAAMRANLAETLTHGREFQF